LANYALEYVNKNN